MDEYEPPANRMLRYFPYEPDADEVSYSDRDPNVLLAEAIAANDRGEALNLPDWMRSVAPNVTPADDSSTYNSIFSRLARTGTGMVHGGLNTMANWFESAQRAGRGQGEASAKPGEGYSFTEAGLGPQDTIAPTGALPMGMALTPRNAVGAMGGKLDHASASTRAGTGLGHPDSVPGASEAARLARATEQGYDPRDFYHGTQSAPFDAFDMSKADTGWRGKAVHTSTDPEQAAFYGGDGTSVMPLRLRIKNTIDYETGRIPPEALTPEQHAKVIDYWGQANIDKHGITPDVLQNAIGSNVTNGILQKLGYDSMKEGAHHMVFDPTNIRSKYAAFNPEDAGKAGLLLSKSDNPTGNLINAAAESQSSTRQQAKAPGAEPSENQMTKFFPW